MCVRVCVCQVGVCVCGCGVGGLVGWGVRGAHVSGACPLCPLCAATPHCVPLWLWFGQRNRAVTKRGGLRTSARSVQHVQRAPFPPIQLPVGGMRTVANVRTSDTRRLARRSVSHPLTPRNPPPPAAPFRSTAADTDTPYQSGHKICGTLPFRYQPLRFPRSEPCAPVHPTVENPRHHVRNVRCTPLCRVRSKRTLSVNGVQWHLYVPKHPCKRTHTMRAHPHPTHPLSPGLFPSPCPHPHPVAGILGRT